MAEPASPDRGSPSIERAHSLIPLRGPEREAAGPAAIDRRRPLRQFVSWPFGYFTFSTLSRVHDLSKSGFSGP